MTKKTVINKFISILLVLCLVTAWGNISIGADTSSPITEQQNELSKGSEQENVTDSEPEGEPLEDLDNETSDVPNVSLDETPDGTDGNTENDSVTSYSPGNPYPQAYTDNNGVYHPGNCTWQAWEEAYQRLGIKLPAWGNADNWYNAAKNAGYTVTPWVPGKYVPSNSIAVWSSQHVAYVVNADERGFTLAEGNIYYNGSWQARLEKYWTYGSRSPHLIGFINLEAATPSINVSWTNGTWPIYDTNAKIMTTISTSSSVNFTDAGAFLWDSSSNLIAAKSEKTSVSGYYMNIQYNITSEMGVTLTPGSTYRYQHWAKFNNSIYHSDIYSFKTTGTLKPTPPSPVTNLKAASAGKNITKLTWDKSQNATGYLIYAQKNGKYTYCGMTTNTAFTDTKALDTKYNFYWVFPYTKDSTGKMYPGSCTKYVFAKGICRPVTNLRAAEVTNGVRLSWTKSSGASGYLVYGKTASGVYGYKGMATSSTLFTDKKASKSQYNFYWVYPYHKDKNGKMIVGGTAKYVFGKAR